MCALVVGAGAETSPGLRQEGTENVAGVSQHACGPSTGSRRTMGTRAQRLTEKAQKFSAQADQLATQPATIESKQGISCNCASHYRYFSKLHAREAKDSEMLAAARATHPGRPGQSGTEVVCRLSTISCKYHLSGSRLECSPSEGLWKR
jgi:hypothetical protein